MRNTASAIDTFSEWTGRIICWMFVLMVAVEVAIVIFRYVFGMGVPAANDLVLYMHAIAFMSLAGYALRHDAHVRVDLLYATATQRVKGIVDLAGVVLFLWPMCAVMAWAGFPYVVSSWAIREGGARVSGIQGTYVLKTFILVFAFLTALQGLSMAIRAIMRIRGRNEPSRPADFDKTVN